MSATQSSRRSSIWLRLGAVPWSSQACRSADAKAAATPADKDKQGWRGGQTRQGRQAEPKVEAVPVEVAKAARHPISASYSGTANLDAPGEAQVVAKTSGVHGAAACRGRRPGQGRAGARRIDRRPGSPRGAEAAEPSCASSRTISAARRSWPPQKLVSVEAIDQIRFDLESARASYELAKLELCYTNITAPISGVIAQRMVKPGNLIHAQCAGVPHRQQLASSRAC